jgi:hypothetical protein
MNKLFAGTQIGKKNISVGLVLFLVYGVVIGIPLTFDMLGGSLMSADQYEAWKVIHAYGVFLAFVNFFFGYCIDRLNTSHRMQEIASWALLVAGLVGVVGRSILLVLSATGGAWSYAASMIETLGFVIATLIFVRGLLAEKPAAIAENPLGQPSPKKI